jgi:hypothetical protein
MAQASRELPAELITGIEGVLYDLPVHMTGNS